jgi:sugar/nucleoside kinase (ribokinase family)
MSQPRLIVAGNACVDLFIPPHAPPPPSGVVNIPPIDVQIGGNGANTAITASRLRVDTALAGVLGDDLFAKHVRERLQAEAVDTSLVEILDGVCGPTTIVVNDDDGERSFVHHPGSNDHYRLSSTTRAQACDVFHFAAPELLGQFFHGDCVRAIKELKEGAGAISLDVIDIDLEGRDTVEAHAPLLDVVDMIFPNEDEARAITGQRHIDDILAYLADRDVKRVVITRGEEGALLSWDGEITTIETRVANVVDTCGAGDNFVAGFLAGFLGGLEPALCARLGCELGTRCVERRGSLAATEDRDRVDELLSRYDLI